MKIVVKWQLQKDKMQINACAVDPVHDQIIIGIGKTIYILNAIDGSEIKKCEKHSQDITCLSYRKDGLWFASGAKDNLIYLWDTANLSKPVNKISFTDPLVQLAYNPCLFILLGISKTGLAIYREKSSKAGTQKVNLSNTAVCVCWTSDGLRFAIGYENGTVSIRDKDNDKELKVINLNPDYLERIWCLSFSSTRYKNKDYVLYVGTWEKNLYMIELLNYTIIDCKKLNYDPVCLSLFKDDYFLLGSNNSEVNFYTKEGIFINTINEALTDWILSLKPLSKLNSFIATTNDGKIICYQISFLIVHGIYNEKYVYRQNLMDIIIHNLNSSNKTKIKTKKYIKKLAVYKNLVAALLNDKIYVYELSEEENTRTPKYIIKWDTEVNLILLTKNHLLICLDNRIISYELNSSTIEREWSFDSDIKYLRVLGGAAGREGLITGLKNGEIYLIYVDNQFPIMLYQHDIPIRSLDVSCNRKKLAIVDENFDIFIVEISTKNIVWKNEKAKSVAFNSDIEDMISYWYDGNVYIKTADFPPLAEKMNGVIVGFRGTKVYLLQAMNNINILDISHSNSIMKYCEDKNFKESYSVASLGATNQEWMFIGFESLLNFELTVAINSFKKVQDIRLINLVFKVEQDLKEGISKDVISGDILSFMGKYKEAADAYIKGGAPEKAMEMYSVLKDWTKAIEIKNTHLQNSDVSITDGLLLQQADWLLGNNKIVEAAEIYWILGKKKKVIEIYGEKGMLSNLIEICRGMNKEDSADLISLCGHYFKQHKHYEYASESYLKLGDSKALVLMNLDLGQFDKAFILAQNDKKLLEYTYLQYADHLVKNDKFHEAQEAFKNGGRVDLSIRLLEKLIDNAVYEKRYKDACMLFVSLANDTLILVKDFTLSGNVNGIATNVKAESQVVKDFYDSSDMIEILVAYDIVYKYIEEPFDSDLVTIDNIGLFNACRFLVNKLANTKSNCKQLKMLSPSYIYYSLGFLSKEFEAFKTSRFSFERLNTLKFPSSWQSKIDSEIISVRSKPYIDKDSNMPLCFRCLNTNPLINQKGDKCTTCSNPFIRSPISFEILPLIEFKPIKGITDDQVIEMIKSAALAKVSKPGFLGNIQGSSSNNPNVNTMTFNNEEDGIQDNFEVRLIEWCENRSTNDDYGTFEADEILLKSLSERDVFIIDQRNICKTKPVKFYKNRMKDTFITMCKYCYKFFKSEEYENLYLKNNKSCPICRKSDNPN